MTTFREMRRPRLALSQEEALTILKNNNLGVLATVNEEGDPRARAVNYALYDDQTLVFHGSKVGEKMDNIKHHSNVSFFVIDRAEILKGQYTTNYRSVSVHGHAEILEGDAAYPYLEDMTKKVDPSSTEQDIHDFTYPHLIGKIAVVLIHIDHLTAKVGSHSPEAGKKK